MARSVYAMLAAMAEHTEPADSPVPTEPSQQSQRLLQRAKGARAMHDRAKPQGLSLRTFRLTTAVAARLGRMPKGVTARPVRYGDTVRGRLVTTADTEPRATIVLWLHGGAFISGSPRSHQKFVARHSVTAGIPIFLPRYRLAPEHPFPAAADDVLAAYRGLLDNGHAPADIRLAGDSSGGALVAGLLGDLTRNNLPMPGATLLLSPLLDLSVERARSRDAAQPDPWISPEFITRTNKAYVGRNSLSDPRLDLLAADMRRWPPTLVQVGGTECIRDDAERFGEAMHAAGARCEVQAWPGQVHGFALFGDKLPESNAALQHASRFLTTPPQQTTP